MPNHSRWEDIKRVRPRAAAVGPSAGRGLDLGQLIHDLRVESGLSQRELAERMGTTQSVVSRLEEGGGARNRVDTLARVATALDRHLVLWFADHEPLYVEDSVRLS